MKDPSSRHLSNNHFIESLWNDTLVTLVVFLTSLKHYLGLFGVCGLRRLWTSVCVLHPL